MEPLVELKEKRSDSWLHASDSKIVGHKYALKLIDRCKGHKGLFLTLTYRRDEYENAQDLYRKSSEQQHVALFFRRLGRILKTNLKGKWVCKLEFQEGGWVHWHIVLLDVERIEHADLTRAWGHGFTWVKRLTNSRIRYMCKYVFKDGTIPAWLLHERPRSVKIVRTSPGFWPKTKEETPQERADRLEEARIQREYIQQPPKWPIYRCIGDKLAQPRQTMVKVGRKVFSVKAPLGCLLAVLRGRGVRVGAGSKRGWMALNVEASDVLNAVAEAQQLGGDGPKSGAPTAVPPRSGGLHLNRTGNRDAPIPCGTGGHVVRSLEHLRELIWALPWMHEWFRQEALEAERIPEATQPSYFPQSKEATYAVAF